MVIYDGSTASDAAVLAGIQRAAGEGIPLFIAVADTQLSGESNAQSSALSDDLLIFARAGARMGAEVDGTFISHPSVEILDGVAKSHGITCLVTTGLDPAGLTGEFARHSDLAHQVIVEGPGPEGDA